MTQRKWLAERNELQAALDGAKLFEQSHKHALTVIERFQKEVNRQKSCILTMAEEIQTLVREKADMQEKIRTYHQHGVTCQTFGHVVGACSECNTHVEQDVNETNHVLASNYLKMLPEFERLTAERDQLLQSAERVRVYKQRCLAAEAERDALQSALDGAKLFEQRHKHALTVIDRANSQAEEFERKWYLACDERDELQVDAARCRAIQAENRRIDPVCALVWKKDKDRNSSEWVNSAGADSMSRELDAIAGEKHD